ncbi:MAG: outer membrane protein assembly factor BamE domain-containing protein [Pseudobdellovibrionaceae bacterium]
MKRYLILLSLSFLMMGCATNMHEQFQRLKVGMEKDEVLSLMSSPQRTQRWRGMDRWTYIFYEEDQRLEKEVHFADGRASYLGEHPKPVVTAEERDAQNESSNKELEALYATQKQEARKAFLDYESHMRGQDNIRFVPQYTPVQ